MPKRIDSLTADQKAQMRPHADRWIDIGLCTDPADFDEQADEIRTVAD